MRRIGTLFLAILMLMTLLIVPVPAAVFAEESTGLEALSVFPVVPRADGITISETNDKSFQIDSGNNLSMKMLFRMKFDETERTYSLTKPYDGDDWTKNVTVTYDDEAKTIDLTFDEALQNHLADKLMRIGREKGWSYEYSYAFIPGDGTRERTDATARMNDTVISINNLDVLDTELTLKNGEDVLLKLARPSHLKDFEVVENPGNIGYTLGVNNQFYYLKMDLKDTTSDYDVTVLKLTTDKRDIPVTVQKLTVTYIESKMTSSVIKETRHDAGTLIVPNPDDFARLGYKVMFEYRPDPRENWIAFPEEGVKLTKNMVISVEYGPDITAKGDFAIALKTATPANLDNLSLTAKASNNPDFTLDSKTLPESAITKGPDFVVFNFTDVPVGPYRNIVVVGMTPVRSNFAADNFNFGEGSGAFVKEIGGPDTKMLILTDSEELEPRLTIDLEIKEAGIEGQLVDPNAKHTAEVGTYVLPSSLSKYVKTTPYTHTFIGWDLDGKPLSEQPVTAQSRTLTVTYEALPETPETTITFVPNNGKDNFTKVLPANHKLEYVLISVSAPRKTGYTFAGWFLDEALTQRPDPDKGLTEDITLYAKFVKKDQYRWVYFSFTARPPVIKLNKGDFKFTLTEKETGEQWTDEDFEFTQTHQTHMVNYNHKLNFGEYLLTMTKERGTPASSSAVIVDGVTTYNITLRPSSYGAPRNDYFSFEYLIDEGFVLKLYEKKFDKFPYSYSDPDPVIKDLYIDMPSHNGWTVGQNKEALDENRPEHEGYRYIGVGPDSKWNNKLYDDSEVLKSSGSNNFARVAYYFVKEYTLAMELNGGSIEGEYKSDYIIGEALELPTPQKPYSTFKGWFLDAEGATPVPEDAKYEENMTVYALWETEPIIEVPEGADDADKPEGYIILTYDVGEGATVKEGAVKYYIDPKAEVRFDAVPAPVLEPKTGYVFSGWSIAADTVLTEDTVAVAQYNTFDDIIPVDATTERPEGYVEVTFAAGEHGTLSGVTAYYVNPEAGKTVADLEAPRVKPAIGYIFKGWDIAETTAIDKDLTVTAEYEALAAIIPVEEGTERPDGYVQVTFAAGEHGTLSGVTEYYVNPEAAKTFADLTAPQVEPATGYIFKGWDVADATVIDKDLVATAEYTELPAIIPVEEDTERPDGYVQVTFAAGEHGTLTGVTEYYVNPEAAKTFADLEAPAVKPATGYTFKGWDIADATVIDKDLVATAEYEALDAIIPADSGVAKPDGYVTVRFVADHAEFETADTFYVNPLAGKTVGDLAAPLPVMEIGYRFLKWDTEATEVVEADMTVKAIIEALDNVIPVKEFNGEKPNGYYRVTYTIAEGEGRLNGRTEFYVRGGFTLLETYAPRIIPADGYIKADPYWSPALPLEITEDTVFTARLTPIAMADIIPMDEIDERPEGYVSVIFAAGTEDANFAETSRYYVKSGTTVTADIAPRTLVGKYYRTAGERMWQPSLPLTVTEDMTLVPYEGWLKRESDVYYYETGLAATGLKTIDGDTYLFNGKGARQSGWHVVGGAEMYFDKTTGKRLLGKRKIGNTIYFLTYNGKLKGWHRLGGKDYYFDPVTGGMLTGKRTVGNTTYLLTQKGKLTGWHVLSGKKYYFDPASGGGMVTGLRTAGGSAYYYFRAEDSAPGANDTGSAVTDTTITLNGVTYTFDARGVMIHKQP